MCDPTITYELLVGKELRALLANVMSQDEAGECSDSALVHTAGVFPSEHFIGRMDLRTYKYMSLHVSVWVQANIPGRISDFQVCGWDKPQVKVSTQQRGTPVICGLHMEQAERTLH